jgi:hypothetical protein
MLMMLKFIPYNHIMDLYVHVQDLALCLITIFWICPEGALQRPRLVCPAEEIFLGT